MNDDLEQESIVLVNRPGNFGELVTQVQPVLLGCC